MGQAERAKRSGLGEAEQRVLMFERQHWCYEGSKESAIRELFDMRPTSYYEWLSRLIDTEEALAFDPQLVKRHAANASNATGRATPADSIRPPSGR